MQLSAGQRQLLAFARALVADPRILILDEATSNVDVHTEGLIEEGMRRLLAGRTAIVIAHRLSTIQHAGRIVVLEHGTIVEQGTHDELLEQQGAYWRLYRDWAEQARGVGRAAPMPPASSSPGLAAFTRRISSGHARPSGAYPSGAALDDRWRSRRRGRRPPLLRHRRA